MAVTYHAGRRIQGTSTDFGDNGAGIPAVSGGWVEVGRTTLGSAGDTISVSSLTDKRYYMILGHIKNTGGDTVSHLRANSDANSNYATRVAVNGATHTTSASDNRFCTTHNSKSIDSRFVQGYIANKSDEEKLGIFHTNGISLAKQIDLASDNFENWWNNEKSIKIKNEFCEKYSRLDFNIELFIEEVKKS